MKIKTLSPKKLILIGALALLLVNGSVFGVMYIVDYFRDPTAAELKAMKEAEEAAALEAIYAKLEPLPEFSSRVNYLRSIGEAVTLCEERLHSTVKMRVSWQANMEQSQYVPSLGIYRVVIEYETVARDSNPGQSVKVVCEVSESEKKVVVWQDESI